MTIAPFLIFLLCCLAFVGVVFLLLWTLVRFGRSESYQMRSKRCPSCGTYRKPIKTGNVRNLVEDELRCPVCGYVTWDVPPKTNLSVQPMDQMQPTRTAQRKF